jgi:hypothetical protein
MKMKFFPALVALCLSTTVFSQGNIAINNTGTSPHISAMLDVNSTTKGVLFPRMTEAQRIAMASPATGLLVYQTNETFGFYYNAGTPASPFWFPVSTIRLPYSGSSSSPEAFKVTALETGNAITGFTADGIGIMGVATGNGSAAVFHAYSGASVSPAVSIQNGSLGKGMYVHMSNQNNGSSGIEILQEGSGHALFAKSSYGSGVRGITESISQAGLIGHNTHGEAVVGITDGANDFVTGVGAVVGRNNGAGYGVRGFVYGHPAEAPASYNSIGVLGQAGIGGNKGVAGRFENTHFNNPSNVLEVTSATKSVTGNGIC